MLYSFDIFDTLITRSTYNALGIFAIMQEKIKLNNAYSDYFKHNFSSIRQEAEANARNYAQFNGKEEIGLSDIYDFVAEYESLTKEDIERLKELECYIEQMCAYPIVENIKRIKELILDNRQVILISDMYLNESVIRSILVSIDAIFENIPIYVSCDYNKTKNIGSLYAYIHDLYGIEYSEWVHVGDNYKSDYLIPSSLGIKSEYENHREKYAWMPDFSDWHINNSLDYQIVYGVVQYISNKNDSAQIKLGKSFAGIIIEEYAEWILLQAMQLNVKELYFIARDGYVIKKVIDNIIKDNNINIKTKYIYGSRKAWRVKEDSKAEYDVIKYFKENVDFNNRIAFVDSNGYGISISEVADMLGKLWDKEIPVYYFNFHRKVESDKCEFYQYCYNYNDIIELLSSATHGTTLGYEEKNSMMVPVIENVDSTNIDLYVEGIITYVNMLNLTKKKLNIDINVRGIVKELSSTKAYSSGMNLDELWNSLNLNDNNSKSNTCTIPIYDYKINAKKRKDLVNVIIYGAGKQGKKIFNKFNNDDKYIISAWVDIDYINYRKQGLPVLSIKEGICKEYDYVVIAMKNQVAIKSAECVLSQLGVDKAKIRYMM